MEVDILCNLEKADALRAVCVSWGNVSRGKAFALSTLKFFAKVQALLLLLLQVCYWAHSQQLPLFFLFPDLLFQYIIKRRFCKDETAFEHVLRINSNTPLGVRDWTRILENQAMSQIEKEKKPKKQI